jgi:drug/metabolite transporter (DMT)-like permease
MQLQSRSLFYLLVYIGTGAANSLLVKRSQVVSADGSHHYAYQPVAVTFCVTATKLTLTCLYVLFFQHPTVSPATTASALLQRSAAFRLFVIPAALYFAFDILAFLNLQLVQPATFRLLINLKVLFSGLLLYLIIGQRLTARQWAALVIVV